MINKINIKILSVFVGFVFFIISLMTLTGYGINWDTINHLPRGQAYLHFILTGKRDFSDLPKFFDGWQKKGQWYWQDPDYLRVKTDLPNNSAPNRSMYQIDDMNYDYFLKTDGDGHPPFSDIMSALFNEVLFRRLKLVNDIDSYRIYGIFLASITVGLVFYWASLIFGKISGLVAALMISLYPLYWSESHFNTEKDVPETAFWTLFMFSFWRGITSKNWKWIIFSAFMFGFALGTKLNIIFGTVVIALWLLVYFFKERGFWKNIKFFLSEKKIFISVLLIPFISIGLLIMTWPYLWSDPINGILKMVGFYSTIGTTKAISTAAMGLNLEPLKWVLYATPIVSLILVSFGLLNVIFSFKNDKYATTILFLLWFLIPILRVVVPGSNIYGGIRQIMEFIPALALLGAGGFDFVTRKINQKASVVLAVLIFTPIFFKIISIHPNENVYFNGLIGGLSGAKQEKLKYWGFSFGSPYRQAASWINKNVPEKANLVYTFDLIPNLPRIWLRTDINLYNGQRSGYLRQGEYAMGLVYDGTEERSYYDTYLEKFIKPIHQIKVDDIAILKIWKNSDEYLINDLKEKTISGVTYQKGPNFIIFDLKKVLKISRLEISYFESKCLPLASGLTYLSRDGNNWEMVGGYLPDDWRIATAGEQPKNGHFIEPFTGQEVRYVKFVLEPQKNCLMNLKNYKVFAFE